MKTCLLVLASLLLSAQQAKADEAAAVTPTLFADQNRNNVPDHEEAPAVTANPDLPSEESVDAEQPIDPPSDGGSEGGEGGSEGGSGGE